MPDRKEITELERVYFEIEKIRARINALSDFLVAKIYDIIMKLRFPVSLSFGDGQGIA